MGNENTRTRNEMFIPVLCFDRLGLNRPILGSLNDYSFFTKSSSETQGQTVGTRESPNGQKNMQRRKVKNGAIWNPTKDFFESLIFSPFFTFLRATVFRPFRLSLVPTICPWVSEDAYICALKRTNWSWLESCRPVNLFFTWNFVNCLNFFAS